MSLYRSFCLWADGMQAGSLYAGKLLYIIGLLPMFAVPLIGEWWWIPSSIFAFAWVAFLLWRFWIMAKTGYIGYVPDKKSPHPIIDGVKPQNEEGN